MAYFRVDTKSALKAMRSAVSAMADNHRKLPTEFFDRIRMLLERRASGVAALDDIIDAILADPDYAAAEAEIRNDASSTRPNLRIV
jgi:hypothetical protein